MENKRLVMLKLETCTFHAGAKPAHLSWKGDSQNCPVKATYTLPAW